MALMSVTRDTSHFEMSPVNVFAPKNISLMSVTVDTSHSPIGPCGLAALSPFADSLRYASTALLSSALDFGENAGVHGVCEIDPDEPANMVVEIALEWTQAGPQSVRLNNFACQNMKSMLETLDTSHFEMSPLNDDAKRNIAGMVRTLDTSHFERSRLNDLAERNIELMSFTLDTSHFEISPLNDVAWENVRPMLVILDTPHSPIGPCAPFEQSPFDSLRHATTALSSCTLDFGENASGGQANS